MGSLPNLRDLDRDTETYRRPTCRRFPVHCGVAGYEPYTRDTIRHTRSMGSYAANALLYTHNEKIVNHLFTDLAYNREGNGYSPISTRSTRSSCTVHHQINNLLRRNSRQRDSMSSSGGASSVRRLIAVVRSTPSKSGPVYSRRLLFRNFAALCLGQAMLAAALTPLLALHSVWWEAGPYLLAGLFAVAAFSALSAVLLADRIGTNWSLISGYTGTCAFLGLHLLPDLYALVPAYILMGFWLGPLVIARTACIMTLAGKLTHVMTEREEGEVDGIRGMRKTEVVVHRLFRGLRIAQDFGSIIGNCATSFLIWYTSKDSPEMDNSLDSIFPEESTGERICGSPSCPMEAGQVNGSTSGSIGCKTSTMLISVFLGFCVMGVAVTAAFMDRIRVQKETPATAYRLVRTAFADSRLQLAAPLALFIGLEQGFIYSDFPKWYVGCALGVSYMSLVFFTLGVLQSIAAFTLSLLIQHIRRHVIIAVGFIFQSCLILVLFIWKPSREDPALFFVVPAAWGVCNAIWDTLSFSLLVSVYGDSWAGAFAACFFYQFLGLSVWFGLAGYLCTWLKLYGLAGALVLAVIPYTWLELKLNSQRRLQLRLAPL